MFLLILLFIYCFILLPNFRFFHFYIIIARQGKRLGSIFIFLDLFYLVLFIIYFYCFYSLFLMVLISL